MLASNSFEPWNDFTFFTDFDGSLSVLTQYAVILMQWCHDRAQSHPARGPCPDGRNVMQSCSHGHLKAYHMWPCVQSMIQRSSHASAQWWRQHSRGAASWACVHMQVSHWRNIQQPSGKWLPLDSGKTDNVKRGELPTALYRETFFIKCTLLIKWPT